MKKTDYCEKAKKNYWEAMDEPNKNLARHVADCPECRRLQKVNDWMQKFAAQTAPPKNLPAPGFLIFKARLIEKQAAATRAVLPIFWAQIASILVFAVGVGWLLLKGETSIGGLLKEAFLSLSTLAPLLAVGAASAVLICSVFAYLLRRTEKLKK